MDSKYWKTTFKIWYDDQRHFGGLGCYRDLKEVWKRHGPCLMTTALLKKGKLNTRDIHEEQKIVSLDYYRDQIRNKRYKDKRLAEFMMDQSRVSGVGNYLRAEIGYKARPLRHH